MPDHRLNASFILGYHGCDREVGRKLIDGIRFKHSKNPYDWLGHGVYFWEANPIRALSFIKDVKKRKGQSDRNVAVVGAVIDMGYCLDLLSESSINLLKDAFVSFRGLMRKAGEPMPKNEGGHDLMLRKLDCAVVNYLHASRNEEGKPSFQTVRGLFTEGKPAFVGSGFQKKTHIQICVRRSANIKGVFKVS